MSNRNNQRIGFLGEQLAAQHLQSHGYTIIERNWRFTLGEIDIVAQQGETLVFVEVRARQDENTENAFASITPAKRRKMLRAAYAYASAHNLPDNALWRIDVIAVAFPRGKHPLIEHAEDALGW
jgi:putative endonuclease